VPFWIHPSLSRCLLSPYHHLRLSMDGRVCHLHRYRCLDISVWPHSGHYPSPPVFFQSPDRTCACLLPSSFRDPHPSVPVRDSCPCIRPHHLFTDRSARVRLPVPCFFAGSLSATSCFCVVPLIKIRFFSQLAHAYTPTVPAIPLIPSYGFLNADPP